MKESKEQAKVRLQQENALLASYAIKNQGVKLKVGMVITQTLTNDKYEVVKLNVGLKCDGNGYNPIEVPSDVHFKIKLIEKGQSIYSKQNKRDVVGRTSYYPYDGITRGSIHFNQ